MEDIVEYSTNVTNLIEGYSLEALNARKMKAKGFPIKDISDITGLTIEEIEALYYN